MHRARGDRVVLTNGAFDLLHVGHTRSLRRARGMGEVLVVGVNSDRSVRAGKGPNRPIVPQDERAEMVASVESVSYVIVFDETTAEALIRTIRPDVYTKGGDYEGRLPPEASVVADYGGAVALTPLEVGRSTSALIDLVKLRSRDARR